MPTSNKPYQCVTVLSGRASERLSEIGWKDRPTIVWLDYDSELNQEILSDVAQVASFVLPGSFLVVTLDATDEALMAEPEEDTVPFDLEEFADASLIRKLNLKCATNLPEETDLTGDGLAEVYRKLVTDKIFASVNSLVDPRSSDPTVQYSQVVNFRYSDGRDMMSIGGVFCPLSPAGESCLPDYGFGKLEFYRPNGTPFRIEVPKLTYRELSGLNQYLPTEDLNSIPVPITEEDKSLYSKIYRYFPTFAEADVSS